MTIELSGSTCSDEVIAQKGALKKINHNFDYLSKLFREGGRAALIDLLDGRSRGPLVVDFDPTTACNFTCPECISLELLNQGKISSKRIEDLIREFSLAGVQGIVFIGGGEPLAHSCMPAPIRQAHDLGIAVGLTTNGSLINRYMGTIAECCNWTRVSMDAGCQETFSAFRPSKIPNSFARILDNMEALARIKRGTLGYSFVLMSRPDDGGVVSNASEIYKAACLAKSIGCDYFELKPMLDMSHTPIPFDEAISRLVQEQIFLARDLCDSCFDVVVTGSIFHLDVYQSGSQKKDYQTCPTMELRTTVTPSGIYPCAYHRGRQDLRIGTVNDGPFNELWIGSARKEAAKKVVPSEHCSFYCARHKINQVIVSLVRLKSEGIDLLDFIKELPVSDVFL